MNNSVFLIQYKRRVIGDGCSLQSTSKRTCRGLPFSIRDHAGYFHKSDHLCKGTLNLTLTHRTSSCTSPLCRMPCLAISCPEATTPSLGPKGCLARASICCGFALCAPCGPCSSWWPAGSQEGRDQALTEPSAPPEISSWVLGTSLMHHTPLPWWPCTARAVTFTLLLNTQDVNMTQRVIMLRAAQNYKRACKHGLRLETGHQALAGCATCPCLGGPAQQRFINEKMWCETDSTAQRNAAQHRANFQPCRFVLNRALFSSQTL